MSYDNFSPKAVYGFQVVYSKIDAYNDQAFHCWIIMKD